MPVYQPRTLTLEAVQDYFMQLNPIAQRIAADIRDTQLAYGQLWDTLKHSEQNDIINETLIKPEISLKYFENYCNSTTSSSPTNSATSSAATVSKSASGDSLTAVVLKNFNSLGGYTKEHRPQHEQQLAKHTKYQPQAPTKGFYHYDGRNLKTFVMQKVALKKIHDDAIGTYRDEHSMPFSYHTKSQINLQLFNMNTDVATSRPNAMLSDDEVCLLEDAPRSMQSTHSALPPMEQQTIFNYKQLQVELKSNLSAAQHHQYQPQKATPTCLSPQQTRNVTHKGSNLNYERLLDKRISMDPPPPPPTNAFTTQKSISSATMSSSSSAFSTATDISSLGESSKQSIKKPPHIAAVKSTTPLVNVSSAAVPGINYSIYGDNYMDYGESSNLMQHCNGILGTGSSSSVATSEDDNDDDKTLCEDVKLLDNDLRKGFDFLNNW